MQTERVTILMTPERKASLAAKAARRQVSTGEFLRRAIDRIPEDEAEEEELAALVAEAGRAIPKMAASLDRLSHHLDEIHQTNDAFLKTLGVRV